MAEYPQDNPREMSSPRNGSCAGIRVCKAVDAMTGLLKPKCWSRDSRHALVDSDGKVDALPSDGELALKAAI